MSFERFEFTKTWLDAEAFPAYEPDEGKVRADLQRLHDEAKDAINRLIDALNDISAAAALPIAPVEGLDAETVQEAIEEVFSAVSDAAAAKIVDGSVTKGKLSAALLKRIYGGRVWMSMNEPTALDDPDHDFPVGQLWLRPAMEVVDISDGAWTVSGGTLAQEEDGTAFISDSTEDYLKAVQTLENVGMSGDHVMIRLDCAASDEVQELCLYINGVETEIEEAGIYETALDAHGSLDLVLLGHLDRAMEGAWVRAAGMGMVDVDALQRQYPDCESCEDWEKELRRLDGKIPMALWIQTAAGRWEQVAFDAVPVSHGGTGLTHVKAGALLYGTGADRLAALPPVEKGILQYSGGKPCLVEPGKLAESCGYLRVQSGSYTGTGGNADRTVELPVTPLMLLLWPRDGSADTACLADGGRDSDTYTFYDGVIVSYEAWVRLQGNSLRFSNERYGNKAGQMLSQHMNAEGVEYQWLAVY